MDNIFALPPIDFKEKLEVIYSISTEVSKRLMYRYMGSVPDLVRNKISKVLVCKFLGEFPMNVPRFYLSFNFEDMSNGQADCSCMDVINPKLWYACNNLTSGTNHFDSDMFKVRYISKGIEHCSTIKGNTILEKIKSI